MIPDPVVRPLFCPMSQRDYDAQLQNQEKKLRKSKSIPELEIIQSQEKKHQNVDVVHAVPTEECAASIADLKRHIVGQPNETLDANLITAETLERFLDYRLTFGKYQGWTWRDVITQDYNYFTWYMTKGPLKRSTMTWKVLSLLL